MCERVCMCVHVCVSVCVHACRSLFQLSWFFVFQSGEIEHKRVHYYIIKQNSRYVKYTAGS